jgi:predicted small integral membrane protein
MIEDATTLALIVGTLSAALGLLGGIAELIDRRRAKRFARACLAKDLLNPDWHWR